MDIAETQLDPEQLETVVAAVRDSKSLMSIHLTKSSEVRAIAKRVMGKWLHNRIYEQNYRTSIPQDWFDKPHVPSVQKDDLTCELSHNLFAERQGSYIL